ncbi:unnamed protein product, partial [Prorocentrum cordatum]
DLDGGGAAETAEPAGTECAGGGGAPAAAALVEVFHAERRGRAFGHPLLLPIRAGERAAAVGARLRACLGAPEAEARGWRLLVSEGPPRQEAARRKPLEETDEWPQGPRGPPQGEPSRAAWRPGGLALCVEREHPVHGPRSSQGANVARKARPLTIRAR